MQISDINFSKKISVGIAGKTEKYEKSNGHICDFFTRAPNKKEQ
jgi:hypothetical protein